MGSGKTTILSEASDLLIARNIPHASIDVDALGTAHLPPTLQNNQLMYRNLQSVWENYAHAGLTRLLLGPRHTRPCRTRAVSQRRIRSQDCICRLTASLKTMQHRVQTREIGTLQNTYIARVAELNSILDRATWNTSRYPTKIAPSPK